MGNLLEMSGATPQKQPRYVPLFIDRAFTGLYTQRSVLHDPSDVTTAKFYGGRPDALWDGSNIELTNRSTLQRRPGLSPFSTAVYPTAPNHGFSFELTDGTIRVIIDTGSSGALVLSAVAASIGTSAVYTGTFPAGAANAYAGLYFTIAGFAGPNNNGTFLCTASTITTITLTTALATAETLAASASTTGGVYWDQQTGGLKTLLFGKSAGAGQTGFVAVAGVLYMGDGVDTKKYTPLNTSGTIWNWGIVAPTSAPSVVTTQSAANAVVWQANTYYMTMGLIFDANGAVEQLYTVNADGSNPTSRYGTSSNGQPAWNQSPGGTTPGDGGVTWTNQGAIGTWTPNTTYQPGAAIYEPGTKCIFIMTHNFASTSGASAPSWNPALVSTGARTSEFNAGGATAARWGSLGQINGSPTLVKSWSASTPFNQYIQPSSGSDPNALNCAIVEPTLVLPAPAGQVVYLQGATTAGTTGSGANPPTWATSAGLTTFDGQLAWINVTGGTNSAVWAPGVQYSSWIPGAKSFGVVKDANGNLQVATSAAGIGTSAGLVPGTTKALVSVANASGGNTTYTAGSPFAVNYPVGSPVTITGFLTAANNGSWKVVSCSGSTLVVSNAAGVAETHAGTATYNPWGTTYNATITDGTVTWTCVGASVAWAQNSIFYLPVSGFAVPSSSQPYGGASVVDTNVPSDIEFVISSGKSGAGVHPTWNAVGVNTTDNTITWYNTGVAPTQSLVWFKGYVYGISFKSRALNDFYSQSTTLNGVTAIPIPPGLATQLPAPTGAKTNTISTASPALTITGGNTGAVNQLSGLGSTDPAVDTIVIWRSTDGGSFASMFELTEIANPPLVGSGPGTWTFQDFLPDVPTAVFPGLNNLVPAPINHVNDPPPSTYIPMVYNFQRIWGSSGPNVFFSGGPDTITGNQNEAFNPSDVFPFLSSVVRIVKTSQGLATFLTNSIEIIAGGPLTASFYQVTLAHGVGLRNYNALDAYAGEIYFFTADSQFKIMSPSLSLANAGFPLGDKFAAMNSLNVQVAVHQVGIDNCIFVADGSTGWYRVNPYQVPGLHGPEPIWSPFANITGGCKMVQSLEVTPGIKKLLVGGTTGGKKILARDLSLYTDDGTPYDAFFVMGSIVLAHPGQLAILRFIEIDFSGVSYQPTVSFLLNEISGSFTPFTLAPVFDPPSLYGTTIVPGSYSPNRYYWAGVNSVARCRHLQIKVDFGTTSNGDELYNLTIFGRLMIEM